MENCRTEKPAESKGVGEQFHARVFAGVYSVEGLFPLAPRIFWVYVACFAVKIFSISVSSVPLW